VSSSEVPLEVSSSEVSLFEPPPKHPAIVIADVTPADCKNSLRVVYPFITIVDSYCDNINVSVLDMFG
jgi:hypothetical protein